jgi:uncharacterized protein
MDTGVTVWNELHRLRQRLPSVSGAVVASVDGMLLASDLPGVDPDPVAALTATSLGLGRQFAHCVGQGPVQESILRTTNGVIATYPAGTRALLAVLADHDTDLTLLHLEARAVAVRVGRLCDGLGGWAPAPTTPSPDDLCAPRLRRLPPPMSPAALHWRRGVPRPPSRP